MSWIRSRWPLAAVAVLALLIAVQAVPYGHARTNPPVVQEPAWDSAATRALARQACFDCHSNETRWPAYSRVAPISWVIERDVTRGREALNFSEWHRPQEEAGDAGEAVREGEMPLLIYRLMHAHARLSRDDRARLVQGLEATLGRAHGEAHDD